MDDTVHSGAASATAPRAGKACDICHARKIKCDRKSPRCSACIAAGHMSCTTSTRPPEKRKRVASVVDEQEAKSVSERLTNLERTLSTIILSQKSSVNTIYTSQEQQRPDSINITRLARDVEDDYNPPFEGASSFTTHSKQVSQAFGSVATSPSATLWNGESPSTLLTGVDHSNDETKERTEYELPSRAVVLKILRAARTDSKRYFDGIADLNLANLTDMCQRVFFPIEDFSSAFMIVVNVCLWKTFDNFGERDLRQHRIDEREFEQAKMICKRTLDRAVRSAPLILDHSYTQIQAILLLKPLGHPWP